MELSKILEERKKQYGTFFDHAHITQHFKRYVREHKSWNYMKVDQQEALDMVLHKIGRIINGNPDNIDSWDDIAGYATLVANRLREDAKGTTG